MNREGFDPKKYLEKQWDKFNKALSSQDERQAFLEFGGKPFGDHHAERVLPGYDAEAKAELLRETVKLADVVMVVNALDILENPDGRKPFGRIRGDSNLMYDKEVVRLIDDAHTRQIPIDRVVITVTPRQMTSANKRKVDMFRHELESRGARLLTHFGVDGYPNPTIFDDGQNPFKDNDQARTDRGLVVVSPGGR